MYIPMGLGAYANGDLVEVRTATGWTRGRVVSALDTLVAVHAVDEEGRNERGSGPWILIVRRAAEIRPTHARGGATATTLPVPGRAGRARA